MLFIIDFSPAIYPAMMLLIAVATFVTNIYVTKKANAKFKREQMDAKADITYVDKEIESVNEKTDLKIELLKQSNEENKTLLEHIVNRIDTIYDKHYKN